MLKKYNNNLEEITPEDAVAILKAGNERFVNGLTYRNALLERVEATKQAQKPFAAILSCMDSRAPVEILYDQGIGDVFSIRVAGNVISTDVLGSLEFAVAAAGSKLVVVMGHSNCGAIKGACDNVEMGHLTSLLDKIKPSIEEEKSITENRNSSNTSFVNKVINRNVFHSVAEILKGSSIVREYYEAGKIKILAAMYFVESGKVHMIEITEENDLQKTPLSLFEQ